MSFSYAVTQPLASPSSSHRDRCTAALVAALDDVCGLPAGDLVIASAEVAQLLEAAVASAAAAAAPSAYSARVRGILFALRRCPQLRRALRRGACTAARIVKSEFSDTIPELLDVIEEEDGLSRGMRLGRFDLPPIPALIVLLYLGPRDLCELRRANRECCAAASGALVWCERTLRDGVATQGGSGGPVAALIARGPGGAVSDCHDLRLVSRGGDDAARRGVRALKLPGERWIEAYARHTAESRARAAADVARAESRLERIHCASCDARTAVVLWATRSMATVRYAQCDACGAQRVIEQSTGDVPVMAYLARG